ncbi:MAG: hypothetical protein ABIZ04_06350 [Opitutus sp.]
MNSVIKFVVCFFIVAAESAVSAAVTSYGGGSTTLTINGVPCGQVQSFEGGDARTSVILETASGSAMPKKHIAGVSYAPIKLVVGFPLPQPVVNCINDLLANLHSRQTLLIAQYDFDRQAVGAPLQANNASLTEVRLPVFDAADTGAAYVTLIFAPQSTQVSTLPAPPFPTAVTNTKIIRASDYKILFGSLPTTRVSRIEPIVIKLPTESSPAEFSNVILTVSRADWADWAAWRDSFVVNGTNDDASEKSGSLELQSTATSSTPAAVLLKLQFSHVGIIRAAPLPVVTATDGAAKFQTELYYESAAIVAAPPPPLTAVTAVAPTTATPAGSATPAPVSTSPVGSTPVASSPVSEIAPIVVPTAPAQTIPTLGTPIGEVAPAPTVRTPGALVGATSTTDQGARDPKDFPRPAGVVRKSYSSITQRGSLQEIAIYTSPEALDPLEEIYMKNLAAAGWELNTRFEDNQAVGRMHQIILNCKRKLDTVTVTLTEVKAGGSEITVNLTSKTGG